MVIKEEEEPLRKSSSSSINDGPSKKQFKDLTKENERLKKNNAELKSKSKIKDSELK